MNHDSHPGSSHPLGATLTPAGVNFSLFSRSASRVELVFFDRDDDARPSRSIELDPGSHRTYHYWHAFVPGVKAGQLYGYRVHGPSEPARGMRFDPAKVLLDPYCQDNEASWFDWTLLEQHADVHRFLKLFTARRLLRGTEHERQRRSLNRLIREANKAWHGVRLNQPDWSDRSRSLAFTAEIRQDRLLFHLILNAYWEPLDFELPPVGNGVGTRWRRWIDTARETPNDIVPWSEAPMVPGLTYRAESRSVVALFAPIQ